MWVMGTPWGGERQYGTEEISETIMTENLPQISIRHQTADPKSSEKVEQDKCPKILHWGISSPNHRKSKTKKNSWKKPVGINITYRGTKIRIAFTFFSEAMHTRREFEEIFKVLTEKSPHQTRILYTMRFFRSQGEMKTFSNKNWGKLFLIELPCKNC